MMCNLYTIPAGLLLRHSKLLHMLLPSKRSSKLELNLLKIRCQLMLL